MHVTFHRHIPPVTLVSGLRRAVTVISVPFPLPCLSTGISTATLQTYLPEDSLVIFVSVKTVQLVFSLCRVRFSTLIVLFFKSSLSHSTLSLDPECDSPGQQQVTFTDPPSGTETSSLWVTFAPDDTPVRRQSDGTSW